MKNRPLAVLCVALLLCPLVPLHFKPETNFHTEWVFAMLVCLAWLLIRQPIDLPRLKQSPVLLILSLVGAAALLSAVLGRGQGPAPVLTVLYCLFAGGVYVLVRGMLGQAEASASVGPSLATAMLLSGLLACVPAAFQLNGLTPGALLVVQRGAAGSIFGNLAQANLLGDWLWLAICAAAYLAASGRIGVTVAMSAIAVLTVFALFTSSRSVWLYGFSALAVIYLTRQRSDGLTPSASMMRFVGAASLIQGAWHVLLTWTGGYALFGIQSTADRLQQLAGDETGGDFRLALWSRGLKIIHNSPWWGEGPGSFTWSALQIMATPGGQGPVPVGENAHNLFLELAVEFGVPLALGVMFLLLWWVRRWWGRGLSPTAQWALVSLAVVGVHSLLEYPLWTTEFLGVALIFFAFVDHELKPRPSGRMLPAAGLQVLGTLGLATLALLYVQFRPAEWSHKEFEMQIALGSGLPFMTNEMVERLESVPDWSPMRSYSEAVAATTATPEAAEAAQWAPLCERAIRFRPSPVIFGRCAIIFELAGQRERADRVAELGCTAYPLAKNYFPNVVRNLTRSMKAERTPEASCLARSGVNRWADSPAAGG